MKFWTILTLTQYFPASYDWNIGGGALPPLQISGSALASSSLSYTYRLYMYSDITCTCMSCVALPSKSQV